jgi:hypothetical protein
MADDLGDAIRENAAGPAEAHGDAGGMKQHPLPDMVDVEKHLAGKDAFRRNPAKAFVRVKMIQPGTV